MRSIVYQLLYVCTRVVPEALLAVNFLCTRVNRYAESDRKKMLRVVQYLNEESTLGLVSHAIMFTSMLMPVMLPTQMPKATPVQL
jgi:hypothetical protein